MHIEKAIHLPDIAFVRLCNDRFGVNKGLYNTIDTFFYDRGFEEILERRKNVLVFLEYIKRTSGTKEQRVKFGSGGLSLKIEEYLKEENKIIQIMKYQSNIATTSRKRVN
ncbi:hypothetical protein ABZ756_10170 [Mammaliicoccus sciuri]|uniref:Uncharacterized protein n=2 Tax=Sporosarcina newyorkensis TaxID=759851 RepID=A0A1T4Y8U4_9BACL|nr:MULTISPECIES: hypothetical protein [Sporosarcina]EGQ26487.1 regulatory protein RibR [Sporosarcina newyorkensis 2681]MBY0223209.1 hypothetical protein [Sporosarcina aquimarina]SKA98110.1 hypothetical protein SAMN04244570_2004 [Sporosarcina newyorkensis]